MTLSTRSTLAAAAVLLLAATAHAQQQQQPRSMRDANSNLGKDASSGIVIWEQKSKPSNSSNATSPAAGASATTTPTSSNAKTGLSPSAAAKAAEEPQPGGSALQRAFNAIREQNPPSGTGLNKAKKLDAPDQGIPVPGTAPAKPGKAEPAPR